MAIEVVNRQRLARVDAGRLARLAEAVLASEGRESEGIGVVLLRDRGIRILNRRYKGLDRATDVLSFPAGDAQRGGGPEGRTLRCSGDIAISVETALRQARAARHSLQREMDELLIHGVLHLCGYDHAVDRGQMNRLELKLRGRLLD